MTTPALPGRRPARDRFVPALGTLRWLLLASIQAGCASPQTPARSGQRVVVPARLEVASSARPPVRGEVVGVLVRQGADTIWLRERPSDSTRAFVLPAGTRLFSRIAEHANDQWAVGDSVRVRGEVMRTGQPWKVTQSWGVEALSGDTVVFAGAPGGPRAALGSLVAESARIERQIRRAHPKRAIIAGTAAIAAGVVVVAAWPQGNSQPCPSGPGFCFSGQDLPRLLRLLLVGSGVFSILTVGVKSVGWQGVQPESLPPSVGSGQSERLEVGVKLPLGPP